MASMKVHLRVSQSVEYRATRLFIRMIHNRKTLSVSLPFWLYPDEWDAKRQEVIVPPGSRRVTYLGKVEKELAGEKSRFFILIAQLEENGEFTVGQLRNAYLGQIRKNSIKTYTEELVNSLVKQGKERTARGYRTAVDKLIEFTGIRGMTFSQLNSRLLLRFESYMKENGKALNTISFYMGNLRAIYNKARKERLFIPAEENIFGDVYTAKENTAKRALSTEEMQRLYNLKLSDPNLDKALRLFLFSFFARGISFIDMAYLRREDLFNDVITYKRKKTKQPIEVKITAPLRHILESFRNETRCTPYLLPIIAPSGPAPRLQYESALRLQNKRLKLISRQAGLQTLSTHIARHSWASIAKTADLPIAVISEGLGHTSLKTTSIYLSSFNRSVLDRANEKVTRLVSKSL